MSTAFRVLLLVGTAVIIIALLVGPAWRGNFYRSWLRPRLVALGLVLVLMGAGEYLYRVITAIRNR